jgi:orotate phosphoribosyltransferase
VRICRGDDQTKIAAYFGATQTNGFTTFVTSASATEPFIDADTYITTERLIADTSTLPPKLPTSIDAVVGIARSGLLPATVLATRLHVPLWHVGKNCPLMPAGGGWRMNGKPLWSKPTHVLLIDDTSASGGSMRESTRLVTQAWPDVALTRTVVYAHPTGRTAVDLAVATLPGRHFLEWNWPNTGHAEIMAFDFDGILCHDIALEDCDDGPRYERALETAKPLHLPRRKPIPLIVTARHERFRQITEAWLDHHGVRAQRLIMRDWPYSNGRHDTSAIARWKAEQYKRSGLALFAESDPTQARLIAELAKMPVLCPAAGRVIRPIDRDTKPRVDKGCRECHRGR